MGILDRFKKKAPKEKCISEGGSYVYHYEEKENKEGEHLKHMEIIQKRWRSIFRSYFHNVSLLCFMRLYQNSYILM